MGDKKSRRSGKGEKRQVAALPVRVDEDGNLLVLLITSRAVSYTHLTLPTKRIV